MQMIYNSDQFAVVRFDITPSAPASDPAPSAAPSPEGVPAALTGWQGIEIVDKRTRMEVFITGALAERFQQGAQQLAQENPTAEAFDEYIAGFAAMSQQPLTLH